MNLDAYPNFNPQDFVGVPVKMGDVTIGKVVEVLPARDFEDGILAKMEIEHRGFPLYFNLPVSLRSIEAVKCTCANRPRFGSPTGGKGVVGWDCKIHGPMRYREEHSDGTP